MEMPKPGPAHEKFSLFAGNWVGDEKIHATPWDPQGGPAVARVDNRLALGGFAIVQDYVQERGGKVSIEGHAVLRWDEPGQQYVMLWWDSMGFPPGEFRGAFHGDVLTMTSESPMGHSRCTFDFTRAGKYDFRLESSPDGSQWAPFIEGSYARK